MGKVTVRRTAKKPSSDEKKTAKVVASKSRTVTEKTNAELTHKTMWSGGRGVTSAPAGDFLFEVASDGVCRFVKVPDEHTRCYSVSHYVRELVGNAADHANSEKPGVVSKIYIIFENRGGKPGFTVVNNGSGFNLDSKMKMKDGSQLWTPEACATRIGVGSNLAAKTDNIGTNGSGLMVVNANCDELILDTIWKKPGTRSKKIVRYSQVFNGLDNNGNFRVNEPDFDKPEDHFIEAIRAGGTSVTAFVNWSLFGISDDTKKNAYFTHLRRDMLTIAAETKIYLDYIYERMSANFSHLAPEILINWSETEVRSISDVSPIKVDFKSMMRNLRGVETTGDDAADAAAASEFTMVTTVSKSHTYGSELPWMVYIGIRSNGGKPTKCSIINGVRVPRGTHIDWALDQIAEFIHGKLDKKFVKSTTAVKAILDIGVIARCIDPEFDSQTKTRITDGKKRWGAQTINPTKMKEFYTKFGEEIMEILYNKSSKRKKIVPTHFPAANCGKPGYSCSLFVPEGKSAAGAFKAAIQTDKLPGFTQDTNGSYDIGGVPINALKNCRKSARDGRYYPNDALLKNVKLMGLFHVAGLGDKFGVDFSIDAEFKKLPYKHMVFLVDQDHDGIGKIMPLLIVAIATFWPELAKRPGYLQWLPTPVVRVYKTSTKKAPIKVFYTMHEFDAWNATSASKEAGLKIFYYKGLGGHDERGKSEVSAMFSVPRRPIIVDKCAGGHIDGYYGDDADCRKRYLSANPPTAADLATEMKDSAVTATTLCEMTVGHDLPVTYVLRTFSHDYMLDTLRRAMPDIGSGLTESRAKFLSVIRGIAGETKVTAIVGRAMADMGYAHGDLSASSTVTNMATVGESANTQVPLVIPGGNVGTPVEGYNDPASARYLKVKRNDQLIRALYPICDIALYPHVTEGTDIYEPEWQAAVLPFILMNVYGMPANGWRTMTYARTWQSLVARTLWYISKKSKTGSESLVIPNAKMQADYAVEDLKSEEEKSDDADSTPVAPKKARSREGRSRKTTAASKKKPATIAKTITAAKIPTVASLLKDAGDKPPMLRIYNHRPGTKIVSVKNRLYSVSDYVINDAMTEVTVNALHMGTYPTAFRDAMLKKKDVKSVHVDIKTCKVVVKFAPGVIAKIQKKKVAAPWSALEREMKLYSPIDSYLNFMDKGTKLVEFKSYEEVFASWYKLRYETYIKRFAYRRVWIKWLIVRLEERQRYSDEYTKINKGKASSKDPITEEELCKQLTKGKYVPLNSAKVTSPGLVAPEEIDDVVKTDASYDYLIGMTVRQLSKKSYMERAAEIEALRTELASIAKDSVIWKIWKTEVQKCADILGKGVHNYWKDF